MTYCVIQCRFIYSAMPCGLCILIIRLTAGLHHDFLGGFGIFSYDSITVVIALCMLSNCWSPFCFASVVVLICVFMVDRMSVLCVWLSPSDASI